MSDINDLLKFTQFSINTKKYGELYFQSIDSTYLHSIIKKIKANETSCLSLLIQNSYRHVEKNKINIDDIDICLLTKSEQKEFIKEFFAVQFSDYTFNNKISLFENLDSAYKQQDEKLKSSLKNITDSIQEKYNMLGLSLSGNFQQLALEGNKCCSVVNDFNNQIENKMEPLKEATKSLNDSLITTFYSKNLVDAVKNLSSFLGPGLAEIKDVATKSAYDQINELLSVKLPNINLPYNSLEIAKELPLEDYSINTVYKDSNKDVDWYLINNETGNTYKANNFDSDIGFINFIHDIPESDVLHFLVVLQNYPFLALHDSVGVKIFNRIQQEITKYTKKINNKEFYHARAKKNKEGEFTVNQMKEAPYGVSSMGRYNFIGKPAFYLAEDEETAKLEVENNENPYSTTIKFVQLLEMNVFDISSEECPLVTYCNIPKKEGNDFSAYLVPNFISSCCLFLNEKNRHSVDAIKYKSNKKKGGFCYVLLDISPSDFFDVGKIVLN